MPINPMSAPASTGAKIPEPHSASDIMPAARVYCALGTMTEIAEE